MRKKLEVVRPAQEADGDGLQALLDVVEAESSKPMHEKSDLAVLFGAIGALGARDVVHDLLQEISEGLLVLNVALGNEEKTLDGDVFTFSLHRKAEACAELHSRLNRRRP